MGEGRGSIYSAFWICGSVSNINLGKFYHCFKCFFCSLFSFFWYSYHTLFGIVPQFSGILFQFFSLFFSIFFYVLEVSIDTSSSSEILQWLSLLMNPSKAFFISFIVFFIFSISFLFFLSISLCLQYQSVLICYLLSLLPVLAY